MNNLAVTLKLNASEEINTLREQANQPIHRDIDAVWVLSGPGTITKPLKTGDLPCRKWMDRDRILYGADLITKITALRLNKHSRNVTREDILQSGPFLIYNGLRMENKDFREVLQSSHLLPYEKVYFVDEVIGKNGIFYSIENTLDQIKSFPRELFSYNLIKKRIAIVSHAEHYPRILRYITKYKTFPKHIKIATFPVKSADNVTIDYHQEEVNKVWEYYTKGHLSWTPAPIEGLTSYLR